MERSRKLPSFINQNSSIQTRIARKLEKLSSHYNSLQTFFEDSHQKIEQRRKDRLHRLHTHPEDRINRFAPIPVKSTPSAGGTGRRRLKATARSSTLPSNRNIFSSFSKAEKSRETTGNDKAAHVVPTNKQGEGDASQSCSIITSNILEVHRGAEVSSCCCVSVPVQTISSEFPSHGVINVATVTKTLPREFAPDVTFRESEPLQQFQNPSVKIPVVVCPDWQPVPSKPLQLTQPAIPVLVPGSNVFKKLRRSSKSHQDVYQEEQVAPVPPPRTVETQTQSSQKTEVQTQTQSSHKTEVQTQTEKESSSPPSTPRTPRPSSWWEAFFSGKKEVPTEIENEKIGSKTDINSKDSEKQVSVESVAALNARGEPQVTVTIYPLHPSGHLPAAEENGYYAKQAQSDTEYHTFSMNNSPYSYYRENALSVAQPTIADPSVAVTEPPTQVNQVASITTETSAVKARRNSCWFCCNANEQKTSASFFSLGAASDVQDKQASSETKPASADIPHFHKVEPTQALADSENGSHGKPQGQPLGLVYSGYHENQAAGEIAAQSKIVGASVAVTEPPNQVASITTETSAVKARRNSCWFCCNVNEQKTSESSFSLGAASDVQDKQASRETKPVSADKPQLHKIEPTQIQADSENGSHGKPQGKPLGLTDTGYGENQAVVGGFSQDGQHGVQATGHYSYYGEQGQQPAGDYSYNGQQTQQPAWDYSYYGEQSQQPARDYSYYGQQTQQQAGDYSYYGEQTQQPAGDYSYNGQQTQQQAGDYSYYGEQTQQPAGDYSYNGQQTQQPAGDYSYYGEQGQQQAWDYSYYGQQTQQPAGDYSYYGQQTQQPAGDYSYNGQQTQQPAGDYSYYGEQGQQPAWDYSYNGQQTQQAPAGDYSYYGEQGQQPAWDYSYYGQHTQQPAGDDSSYGEQTHQPAGDYSYYGEQGQQQAGDYSYYGQQGQQPAGQQPAGEQSAGDYSSYGEQSQQPAGEYSYCGEQGQQPAGVFSEKQDQHAADYSYKGEYPHNGGQKQHENGTDPNYIAVDRPDVSSLDFEPRAQPSTEVNGKHEAKPVVAEADLSLEFKGGQARGSDVSNVSRKEVQEGVGGPDKLKYASKFGEGKISPPSVSRPPLKPTPRVPVRSSKSRIPSPRAKTRPVYGVWHKGQSPSKKNYEIFWCSPDPQSSKVALLHNRYGVPLGYEPRKRPPCPKFIPTALPSGMSLEGYHPYYPLEMRHSAPSPPVEHREEIVQEEERVIEEEGVIEGEDELEFSESELLSDSIEWSRHSSETESETESEYQEESSDGSESTWKYGCSPCCQMHPVHSSFGSLESILEEPPSLSLSTPREVSSDANSVRESPRFYPTEDLWNTDLQILTSKTISEDQDHPAETLPDVSKITQEESLFEVEKEDLGDSSFKPVKNAEDLFHAKEVGESLLTIPSPQPPAKQPVVQPVLPISLSESPPHQQREEPVSETASATVSQSSAVSKKLYSTLVESRMSTVLNNLLLGGSYSPGSVVRPISIPTTQNSGSSTANVGLGKGMPLVGSASLQTPCYPDNWKILGSRLLDASWEVVQIQNTRREGGWRGLNKVPNIRSKPTRSGLGLPMRRACCGTYGDCSAGNCTLVSSYKQLYKKNVAYGATTISPSLASPLTGPASVVPVS